MRIGAVNYLNSKPLVHGLELLAPEVRLCYDLPSRLADSLAAGRLDVALIPTVEFFRGPGYSIVSDACVACRGPVLSVKLHFRVPPAEVRKVALDEGSRTSAALTQILLAELCGVHPEWETLPIGCGLDATDADAVLLIGDRAIADCGLRIADCGLQDRSLNPKSKIRNPKSIHPTGTNAPEVWDLGERWCRWTGLPFVFAMWIARPGVDTAEVAAILAAARDAGIRHLAEIASRESLAIRIPPDVAKGYLRDNLHFTLGGRERQGLRRFYRLCTAHGLAPRGLEPILEEITAHDCPTN
jgi:chorismate dehydratase